MNTPQVTPELRVRQKVIFHGDQGELAQSPADRALKVHSVENAPTLLASAALSASAEIIYTFTAQYRDISVYLTNVDSAEHTASLGINGSGDSNLLRHDVAISPTENFKAVFIPGLGPGYKLYALCDEAAKVTAHIFGVKVLNA
jgi:azurin